MGTGYTNGVQHGKVTTLGDFVKVCAHSFFYDGNMDKPLSQYKDRDSMASYHRKALSEAEAEHTRVSGLTADQTQLEAEKYHAERLKSHHECRERQRVIQQRYRNMQMLVADWSPALESLQKLKTFMLDQLKQSENFDCGSVDDPIPGEGLPVDGDEWKAEKLTRIEWDIDYHQRELAKAQESFARSVQFIDAIYGEFGAEAQ